MKLKTVVYLVLAVVIGTAASRVSKRLLSGPPEPEPEPPAANANILVAKQTLKAGTKLHEPDRFFEERTVAKNKAPAGAIARLYQLRGRKLAKTIGSKDVITAEFLVDDESENLDLLKKEGRQAVAVRVQSLGNYWFLPQSRVDFIWTNSVESRVIVQDVPLLGVQSQDGGPAIVTVAAKRDDAEKLSQAATQGTLQVVLRAPQR
jgi:Flp pilus assembly protein CpaB